MVQHMIYFKLHDAHESYGKAPCSSVVHHIILWALPRPLWEYINHFSLQYFPPSHPSPTEVHSALRLLLSTFPWDCPPIFLVALFSVLATGIPSTIIHTDNSLPPTALHSVLATGIPFHHHPHFQLSVLNPSLVAPTSLEWSWPTNPICYQVIILVEDSTNPVSLITYYFNQLPCLSQQEESIDLSGFPSLYQVEKSFTVKCWSYYPFINYS